MSYMMQGNVSENILIQFNNIIKNNKLLYTFEEMVYCGTIIRW